MVVTINPLATAFAGEDDEIKEYETYTLSGAMAENYTSIQWTTSGDGAFDNANSQNPSILQAQMILLRKRLCLRLRL